MSYTRQHKLEWLQETCSQEFINKVLLQEMVRWMGEDNFEQFYDHLCRNWNIVRGPGDPNRDEDDEECGFRSGIWEIVPAKDAN